MRLVWHLNRLSRMSPAEVLHRVVHVAKTRLERAGIGSVSYPGVQRKPDSKPWVEVLPRRFEADKYSIAADRVLDGIYTVFAHRDVRLGFPPNWNLDPKTGTVAPLSFGKTLDYRNERLVGDIKYLWEPNRHLELVTLAQAWQLTRQSRYLEGCRAVLASWIEQCPFPFGANWTSSLEHGVRLVNWAFAWHLLGGVTSPLFQGKQGEPLLERWLECIYRHCRFIAGHLSGFSSANNHLLGEYMGLFVASTTWNAWNESDRWRARARIGFERESLLQNFPDGVNREQAIWYHHEVADMMLICGLIARAQREDFGSAYWGRLESMLEFVASAMDFHGNVPMIGDSDDAVMLRLDPGRSLNVYRSLLATGAVLFRRGDFKVKARSLDDKTQWLLGDGARTSFDRLAEATPKPRRTFGDAGYYILGSDFETDTEVRIVADAGELGYLSIAAHGHADALSFTLSAGGQPLLIDPGTYAYHTNERWRNYFKGTSAHNTVRIDGVDQSVSGGKFLWLKHARAHCDLFSSEEGLDLWQGSHDGYCRLSDPVRVVRSIHYEHASRRAAIEDKLACAAEHLVEMFWHFAPECKAELDGSVLWVYRGRVRMRLELPCGLQIELLRGDEQKPAGWYSHGFDEKQPATTLRVHAQLRGNQVLKTKIEIKFSPDVAANEFS